MNAVESWEDENSIGRCTATHVAASADGDTTIRCDGQAGHAGPKHQGHIGPHIVRWRGEPPGADREG